VPIEDSCAGKFKLLTLETFQGNMEFFDSEWLVWQLVNRKFLEKGRIAPSLSEPLDCRPLRAHHRRSVRSGHFPDIFRYLEFAYRLSKTKVSVII